MTRPIRLAGALLACLLLAGPGLAQENEGPDETRVLTPGTITNVEVARGGQLLLLKMKDVSGLAVLDTESAKIAKIIKLPSSDFLFGAGGDTVVIYFPENNILQSWDLANFQKKKTKPNPVSGVVLRIVMGHSEGDVAMIRYSEGTDALDTALNFLLDTRTLRPLDDKRIRGHNTSYRDYVHLRASGNLAHISEWATSHSPTGVSVYNRVSRNEYQVKYEHDSEGYLAMGEDGRLYSGTGAIFSSDLVSLGRIKGSRLIPGLGGTLVLGIDGEGKLTVYPAGKTTPLGPCGRFPGWPKGDRHSSPFSDAWARTTFVFDRRIIFAPNHGRLMFIPKENDGVIIRSFDLKGALDSSGVDYLAVTSAPTTQVEPGKAWEYQVEAISKGGGIEYELQLAPEGMTVSKDGLLRWNVPRRFSGREQVVLLLSDSTEEQTYHNFWLESGK